MLRGRKMDWLRVARTLRCDERETAMRADPTSPEITLFSESRISETPTGNTPWCHTGHHHVERGYLLELEP